jgi:hypothetical protein
MAIHEQLPRQTHRDLKQMGWTKAAELAKVARRNGEKFDCATWLHKAQELPKEEFKREVERHLTRQETEPWEILYFKVYKSQLQVIERALETASLMLGSQPSRGYCFEMICADFLVGASLAETDSKIFSDSVRRLLQFVPGPTRQELIRSLNESA